MLYRSVDILRELCLPLFNLCSSCLFSRGTVLFGIALIHTIKTSPHKQKASIDSVLSVVLLVCVQHLFLYLKQHDMCPKDTDRPENELWRNFKGKIRLFWTKFSYCIFVQSSSTGLYGVPMAIILQPISIRKCNINTLTTHFLATQGKSINRELIFLQILSPSFSVTLPSF